MRGPVFGAAFRPHKPVRKTDPIFWWSSRALRICGRLSALFAHPALARIFNNVDQHLPAARSCFPAIQRPRIFLYVYRRPRAYTGWCRALHTTQDNERRLDRLGTAMASRQELPQANRDDTHPRHYLSLRKREKGAEMARIVTSSHAIARRSCRSRVSADARLFPHASRPRRYLFPDRREKGPEMARIVAFSQVPRRSCRST